MPQPRHPRRVAPFRFGVVTLAISIALMTTSSPVVAESPGRLDSIPLNAGVPVTDPPVAEATTDDSMADESPIATNDFLDLERELSECISSNPLPGCGREPTSPGDRGGWQQLLLFGILMTGMAVILGRVFVAVRRGDRERST